VYRLQILKVRERALRALEALAPPPADAASVAHMLRYFANGQSFAVRAFRLGKSGKLKPLVAAARADQINARGRRIARHLGLRRCATF
jgi:hypothetical protein